MSNILEQLKEKAPEIVKNNKGALIGAVFGYLLSDSKEAQSVILGALAGTVIEAKNDKK